jgi:hypothetical protein
MKVTYFFGFAPAGDGKIANLFLQCGATVASVIVGIKKRLAKSREKKFTRPLPSAKGLLASVLDTHLFQCRSGSREQIVSKLIQSQNNEDPESITLKVKSYTSLSFLKHYLFYNRKKRNETYFK